MAHFRVKVLGTTFVVLALVTLVSGVARHGISMLAQAASGLPDYAIQDLSVSPAVPEPGEEMSFHGTVKNVGTSRGTHRDFVRLQLDEGNNGTWDYTSTLNIVGGLPVGASQFVQWGITGIPPPIAWSPVAGTHTMKICMHIPSSTDVEAYTADANPANDCNTFTFTVSGGTAASSSSSQAPRSSSSLSSAPRSSSSSSAQTSTVVLPDFVIATFSLSAGPSQGKFSAGITVKNLGADWNGMTHAILE
jgi:hypothetical protein